MAARSHTMILFGFAWALSTGVGTVREARAQATRPPAGTVADARPDRAGVSRNVSQRVRRRLETRLNTRLEKQNATGLTVRPSHTAPEPLTQSTAPAPTAPKP